jgi:cysteine desulfurase
MSNSSNKHFPLIYLDYNATTPVDRGVIDFMWPFIADHFGNPSSSHALGTYAKKTISKARRSLAEALGAQDDVVVFTGGGSEANNLAIKGIAHAFQRKGKHVIISSIEHPSIAAPVHFLSEQGYKISIIPVNTNGIVNMEALEKAIKPDTVLVSIMLANNEVGTIQPIADIASMAHSRGVLVHTDAAQAIGKIPVSMKDLGVDLLSVAGHKFYAPTGIGALLFRKNLMPEPLIHGAGHENGFRAGTENTPYIVALSKAAEISVTRLDEFKKRVKPLRDQLEEALINAYPNAVVNGDSDKRLCNTLNISFPGIDSAQLMESIQDRIACSTGPACHSGRAEPSQILLNMGRSNDLAKSALRFSLGWQTTHDEIKEASDYLASKLEALAGLTAGLRPFSK